MEHEINVLALDVMMPADDTARLLAHIGKESEVSIADLFAAFPGTDRPRIWRTVGWLIELGILGRRPASA